MGAEVPCSAARHKRGRRKSRHRNRFAGKTMREWGWREWGRPLGR